MPPDHPSEVGPYRILDKLGEGGMAEVYLAEQSEPVKRRVALKILKPGMDSREVLARFESERQALAMLDHPNIAKVFDGGMAESGRPYFVMERVQGVPITAYCDEQRLSTDARLRLFIDVCCAVQHAHLKGLIHRDLKPSNILVGAVDSRPQPKIIDFGIAKATTVPLTDATLYTRFGQLVGTPQYMSPEQANLTGLDIDTRTDIYSLGIVLYELLVGTVPIELGALGDEVMRTILREKDPPTPSTRYTSLGDSMAEIARVRATDPDALRRVLKGDLDWIVMKAIEKDRTRRYETANALAMECRRFLRHEPVLARPPSAGYLLRRFVRRNRTAVSAAAITILAIVAGAVTATIGMVRAIEAERVALTEAETARQVSRFLVDLFEVSDPGETRGNTITAREVLDAGARRIETELAGQPGVQATLMRTIGRVYHKLGLYQAAGALLEKALESGRTAGADPLSRATTLQMWSELLVDRGDYAGAEELLDEATEISVGAAAAASVRASLLTSRAFLYRHQARYPEAEAALTEAVSILEASDAAGRADVADSIYALAVIYRRSGDYDQAESAFLKALEIQESVLPRDHPDIATTLNGLAILHVRRKEWVLAERRQLRALAIREKALGERHPEFAKSLNNLAGIYLMQGRPEDAAPHLERALEIRQQALGPTHPSIAENMHNLAVLHLEIEDLEAAEAWERRAIAIKEQSLGPDHPDVALSLHNYGTILARLGRDEEAEAMYRRALDAQERQLGAEHPQTADTARSLAAFLRAAGREAEAAAIRPDREAIE